jgi:hypothetical protein
MNLLDFLSGVFFGLGIGFRLGTWIYSLHHRAIKQAKR